MPDIDPDASLAPGMHQALVGDAARRWRSLRSPSRRVFVMARVVPRDLGSGKHWTRWYKGRTAKRRTKRDPYDFTSEDRVMCGRVRLGTDFSQIRIKLKFDKAAAAPNVPASWNVCPTDPMVFAVREDEKRIPQQMVIAMAWGAGGNARRVQSAPGAVSR